MARNLVAAGYEVVGHDLDAARAEGFAAEGPAEIAIASLPSAAAVEEVARALPGTGVEVFVDMSTSPPALARQLADELAAHGVVSLDAPVSGGPPGAEAGTLSIMAGGKQDVFDACLPLLQTMGKTITRVGDLGAGQVTKACNQVVIAATLAGIAEALVLGAKAGVDPALIRQALLGGYAGSRLLEVHGQRMIDHAFDPGFFVKLHDKDLHIVLDMARSLSVSAPVTALAAQHFNALIADGDGELDNSAMLKVYERLARATIA